MKVLLILFVLVLTPFLIWGDWFETFFDVEGTRSWMAGYGQWAWAAAMVLLVLDLFLPLPGTVIMTCLGLEYGGLLGGLISAAGSILSGILAYGLCRRFGTGMARKIAGESSFQQWEGVFERSGGWIVVLSRWLPMAPEIVACKAGLVRMPASRFLAALVCGSVPLGFAFAALGHFGREHPVLTVALSAFIPPILWFLARGLIRKKSTTAS